MVAATLAPVGSSPHTRGARRVGADPAKQARIIPAYAGSTTKDAVDALSAAGSSPHTRGAPTSTASTPLWRRIIPAYAGSTCRGAGFACCRGDHPRIRGEHRLDIPWPQAMQGSSPHTRGARFRTAPRGGRRWIIPAYAGSTRGVKQYASKKADHPRIRGEHTPTRSPPATGVGSSPHTRGARQASPKHGVRERIIPAYAGSTIVSPPRSTACGDHPRIRGEHPICVISAV